MSNSGRFEELRAERAYIASLYGRVDTERVAAAEELDAVLRAETAVGEARWQREVATGRLMNRMNQLRHADSGLCFGRVDHTAGNSRYIGRIGLLDHEDDLQSLLMDWRAPASRPFYCATAADPEGLSRRRHFRTRGRTVLDYQDDFLAEGEVSATALMEALNAPREKTMRDIVATIQAEQDDIIRFDSQGILVIEGGPGTGKTAVALHRTAYLLYTERARLSRRGILIIGPHPNFVQYIGDVLPSLGETDVVFATPGDLLPGLNVTQPESPKVAAIKGGLRMVDVLAAAVADRQEMPDEPIEIELDDVTVWLDQDVARTARDQARAGAALHNKARPIFREALIARLSAFAVDRIGEGWLEPDDLHVRADLTADVRFELASNVQLHEAIDLLWPRLSPQRLLSELFTSWRRLAAAVPDPADRAALYRSNGDAWTVSDVPLLDEAIEFLGQTAHENQRNASNDTEYTRGVLEILDTEEDSDGEMLRAVDLIDAESLAERHRERDGRAVADRAVADRDWTYGHVVIDEAQEMSAMDWRVIMRRCPSKSITAVGDLAQRQSAAGARKWAEMLDPYAPGRWSYRKLDINYRTPSEIMSIAAGVLAEVNPELAPPESVRSNGIRPSFRSCDSITAALPDVCQNDLAEVGTMVIIAPEGVVVDAPVEVCTPRQVKGLEFDTVVIVEPQRIYAYQPHGPAELYVALTRATQRLRILHTEPLPPCLNYDEGQRESTV